MRKNLDGFLAPHPLGGLARPGEVTHMCPDCGDPATFDRPPDRICPTCLGAGQVSTDQLAAYQRQLDATGVM